MPKTSIEEQQERSDCVIIPTVIAAFLYLFLVSV